MGPKPHIRQTADRIARLQAITAALSRSLTPAQVAEVVVEQGVAALGGQAGLVALLTEDGAELELARSLGYPPESMRRWHRFPLNAPYPVSEAVRDAAPLFLENGQVWARRYPELAAEIAKGDQAAAALPLTIEGRAFGALYLTFPDARAFSEEDRAFIMALARQCAQALERARLYEAERAAREAAEREIGERRQAEEALKVSEARFRTLIEQSPLSIQILGPDGWTVQVNRAWEQLWGVTLEQISDYNMLQDEQLAAKGILPYIQRAFAGQAAAIPPILYDPDQTLPGRSKHDDSGRWVRAVIYPVKDEAGGLREVVLMHEDITERRRAEAAREASEARLRLALDAARMGIWEWNIRTGGLRWSDQLEPIHGLAPGTFDGTFETFVSAIYPDDRELVTGGIARALESGTDFNIEFRVAWPDGSIHWVAGEGSVFRDESGQPERMIGVGMDITARKQAEAEVAAAYKKAKRIAETLQRSMLIEPEEKAFPGLDVAPVYQPAWDEAQVGGDFYDLFALSGRKVALAVGDVSGKGLAAAAITAEVKFVLRGYLREHADPAQALTRLGHYLCDLQEMEGDTFGFIALALLVIDTVSGEAAAASAGAEPLLLLRADGGVTVVGAGGLALGIDGGAEYATTALRLSEGDTILMTTDGFTEARQERVFLGQEGLIGLAKQALPLRSARQIGEAILEGARGFTGGRLQDDACLLLARRLP